MSIDLQSQFQVMCSCLIILELSEPVRLGTHLYSWNLQKRKKKSKLLTGVIYFLFLDIRK